MLSDTLWCAAQRPGRCAEGDAGGAGSAAHPGEKNLKTVQTWRDFFCRRWLPGSGSLI